MPAHNERIVTVGETGQFFPRKGKRSPVYLISRVHIDGGIMKASLQGGYSARDIPGGSVSTTLIVGEPFHAPYTGTFTLLDVSPAQSLEGHGSATFRFEPDPDFEVSDTI